MGSKQLDISSQSTAANGVFISEDGVYLFLTDDGSNKVYRYTLSTPWDVSTGAFDTGQEYATAGLSSPFDLWFKPDGTVMYVASANTTVHQYTLGTAWDISASVTSDGSYNASTQDNNITAVAFDPTDGLTMFLLGDQNNTVYEYAVTTAWDLTGTVTYSSSSLSVGTEEVTPVGLFIDDTGTYVFTGGNTNANRYSLGTVFTLSTGSFDTGQTFAFTEGASSKRGMFFKYDGTQMYHVIRSDNDVIQYSLTTPWDITTAEFLPTIPEPNGELDVSAHISAPSGIYIGDSGTKLYVADTGGDSLYRYTLANAWEVSSGLLDTEQTLSLSAGNFTPADIWFKPDGTKLYVVDDYDNAVAQWTLSTAWDLSSATYDGSHVVSLQISSPRGVTLSGDGLKVFVGDSANNRVTEYEVTTAWDLTGTVTYNSNHGDVSGETLSMNALYTEEVNDYMIVNNYTNTYRYTFGTARDITSVTYDTGQTFAFTEADASNALGLFFKDDGTEMYVGSTASPDTIFQYTLGTAWDTTTADHTPSIAGAARELDVSTQTTNPQGVFIGNGGTMLYVSDKSTNVYRYTLSTPYDVSTGTFDTGQTMAINGSNNFNIWMSTAGDKMFIGSFTGGGVEYYDLTTNWDLSTGSYSGIYSISSQDSGCVGASFNPDGSKMYVSGTTNEKVFEYDLTTPWDLSGTVTYSTNSLDVSAQTINIVHVLMENGTHDYALVAESTAVYRYSLSIGEDISSGTFDTGQSFTYTEGTNNSGMYFHPAGTKLYTVSSGDDVVYQYELSDDWDVTTAEFQAPLRADASVTITPTVTAEAHGTNHADGDVTITPTVTAEAHGTNHADGDVTITPTVVVTASNNTLHADGDLTITPTMSSTGRVELHANGSVTITPTVVATGKGTLHADASVTVTPTVVATGENVTLHADASVALAPTVVTTGDVFSTIYGSMTMPALTITAEADQTVSSDMTMPALTMESYAVNGTAVTGGMTIPALTVEAYGANDADVELPMLVVEAAMISSNVMSGDMVLPALIVNSEFGNDRVLSSEGIIEIPSLTMTGMVANSPGMVANMTLPALEAYGVNVSGSVVTGDMAVSAMEMDDVVSQLVSAGIITGELELPSLRVEAYMEIVVTLTHSGWSTNTESLRTSEYDNFNYMLLANAFGKNIGVASDGLYELAGDDDNGTAIAADVLFGLDSFRTEDLKRIKTVHMGYRADNSGDLTVQIVVDGEEKIREYSIKHISHANGIKRGRATIAKGLKSRYWMYGFKNVLGADFTVDDLSIFVQQHNRKAQ